jgi:hypothetical protein
MDKYIGFDAHGNNVPGFPLRYDGLNVVCGDLAVRQPFELTGYGLTCAETSPGPSPRRA